MENNTIARLPTIRGVNFVYLVTISLLLTVGVALQAWEPIWGVVLTEFLLILPVAILYIVLTRRPVAETLLLRWPGWRQAGLSLLIAAAVTFFAIWLGYWLSILFGYTFPVPPEMFPRTIGEAAVLFLALTIAAPLCEEALFRGVVQRGYERWGPWPSILIGGFLFAAFHLSFQRLFAIVPIALVLGYMYWRTRSLWSSILGHFAYNLVATILTVLASFRPDIDQSILYSTPLALAGLAVAAGGLAWLTRITAPQLHPQVHPERSSWFGKGWSIAVALLLFALAAVGELALLRFPELLPAQPLNLSAPDWELPSTYRYRIYNPTDQEVGWAECTLAASGPGYSLGCQEQVDAFEADTGSSFFSSEGYERDVQATWDGSALLLLEATIREENPQEVLLLQARREDGELLISGEYGESDTQTFTVPPESILTGEWPWRLSGLAWQTTTTQRTTLIWLSQYSEALNRGIPQAEGEILLLSGAEPVAVPAGNFIAWRVNLGRQTAFYDSEAPHVLLLYDSDFVRYELSEYE